MYKKGDKIELQNVDETVKNYLKETLFSNIFYVERLRIYCELQKGKKYRITDVCKPCKRVTILVNRVKNTHVIIKFNEIK